MAILQRLLRPAPGGILNRFPSSLGTLSTRRPIRKLSAASSREEEGEREGRKGLGTDVRVRIQQQILLAGLRILKGDAQTLKENAIRRAATADVDKLLCLHQEYKKLLRSIEELRQERNQISKQFNRLKEKEEKDQLVSRGAEVKRTIADLEGEKLKKEEELVSELSFLPNSTHPGVPEGDYEQARVVYTHGTKPEFPFPVRDHVDIGERLGLFDFSSAAKVTGQSFYYLKEAGAMLEVALIQYAIQKAVAKGFQPIITPDVIKTDVVEGCGFHPRGANTEVYSLSSRHGHFSLSGTAEIPLAGMFMDENIQLSKFPKRLVAFGRCFRAETGGYGRAVRGLYRVHQFSKVELFGLTAAEAEESSELLEEIVNFQKEICEDLGFHYRLLDMPSEELGAPAYRKYDVEVWMPGRDDYGEVASASNCTDFQSQRLRITYDNPSKQCDGGPNRKYAHTVNGTACAIPRTILALLENNQQEDGSVLLPKALHPFLPQEYWHIH